MLRSLEVVFRADFLMPYLQDVEQLAKRAKPCGRGLPPCLGTDLCIDNGCRKRAKGSDCADGLIETTVFTRADKPKYGRPIDRFCLPKSLGCCGKTTDNFSIPTLTSLTWTCQQYDCSKQQN